MKLSNGKMMDIEDKIKTILKKNPGMKAKDLVFELKIQTRMGRSAIYGHITRLYETGGIFRKHGRYWLEKPSSASDEISPERKTEIESKVRNVIGSWKEESANQYLSRCLTLPEILYKIGESSESSQVRILADQTAIKGGWTPQEICRELVKHAQTDLRLGIESWISHLRPPKGRVLGSEPLEDLYGLGAIHWNGKELDVSSPTEPNDENFRCLRDHLRKSLIEENWTQLKEQSKMYLDSLAKPLRRIGAEFLKEGLPDFYDIDGSKMDPDTVAHARTATAVETAYKILKGVDIGKPSLDKDKGMWMVSVKGACLFRSWSREQAAHLASTFEEQTVWPENVSGIAAALKKREKLNQQIIGFERQLEEILSRLDDKHYFKGYCDRCNHLSSART